MTMYVAQDGKQYHEITFEPQEQVSCHCGKTLYRSPCVKLMDILIYEYNCPWCGYSANVHSKSTIEHWPKEIKDNLRDW